jgi:transposase
VAVSGQDSGHELQHLRYVVEELTAKLRESEKHNRLLADQLERLKKLLFGRRSERFIDHPSLPFAEDQAEPKPPHVDEAPDDEGEVQVGAHKRKRTHGITRLRDDLPEDRTVIELPEAERLCPCCNKPKQPIGEEVSEELDYQPASFFKRVTVRIKYACPAHEEGGVTTPSAPPRVIVRGMAGPGLLAQVLTSKYKDHLPLHRQHGIYLRHGVDIPETTMVSWVKAGHELLTPVVEVMQKAVADSARVNSDDTGIVVQDRHHAGGSRNGFVWVYISPDLDAVFTYTAGRTRTGPMSFFEKRREDRAPGVLQVDAYSGYEALLRTGKMVEAGCWAHARRGFHNALGMVPEEAGNVLATIRRLYDIERDATQHGFDDDMRLALRKQESAPLLEALWGYLEALHGTPIALPESALGKAITYAFNQRAALSRFLENASIPLDNNIAERALRQVVVGRKNWLFAGSDEGAKRAATIYSVVVSCWLRKIDPFAYLRDVLLRLAAGEDPAALTPRAWEAAARTRTAAT